MPISCDLLRDGRVCLCTYPPTYSNVDVADMVDVLQHQILANATKPVHTISDFRAVQKLPTNSLGNTMKMMRKRHPMEGAMILVSSNEFIRRMIMIVSKMRSSYTIITCTSVEEALAEADHLIAEEARQAAVQSELAQPV